MTESDEYDKEFIELIKYLHKWLVLDGGEMGRAIGVKPDAPEDIKKDPKGYISIYNYFMLCESGY